jgi:hypothetical protein
MQWFNSIIEVAQLPRDFRLSPCLCVGDVLETTLIWGPCHSASLLLCRTHLEPLSRGHDESISYQNMHGEREHEACNKDCQREGRIERCNFMYWALCCQTE